jgi:RNA polymerase sigma factor (sigma-70 family)
MIHQEDLLPMGCVKDPLRFARTCARRTKHVFMDVDDRTQECAIGILRAERTYDPAKGRFEPYAIQLARFQVITAAERILRGPVQTYVDPEQLDRTLTAVYSERWRDEAHARLDVEELLKGLDARLQKIVRLRWGLGEERPRTCSEIGPMLDPPVTRQRVHQLEKIAMQALKDKAKANSEDAISSREEVQS